MEDWMALVIVLLVFLPIVIGVLIVDSCMQLNRITEMMERVFKGEAAEDLDIALKSGLAPEDLCYPLTAEMLRRIHACGQVKRARVKADLRHPMKMLLSIAEIDVTYDFEGTEPDGQMLTLHEAARVRVYFEQTRYSHTIIVKQVE